MTIITLDKVLSGKEKIPDEFWDSTRKILNIFLEENKYNRRVRKDVTRVLDIITVIDDKNTDGVLEILNTVSPSRHPTISSGDKIRICKKEVHQKGSMN